jgi:large subunit ribosomal protein L13
MVDTMKEATEAKEYVIDATGEKIGRLASRVAVLLMGKKEMDYAPNKVSNIRVKITNASKLAIPAEKKEEMTYFHYTGFHGGGRVTPLKRVIEKKGYGEVIKRAVKGMLPKNKLQSSRLARLEVEE